jgi:lipoprotein-releasing system permease protein
VPGLIRTLPFSWAVGLTLFAGRGRSRVSSATVVSAVGIGVGVATLTAVLAVTGGFETAFRERILGVYPHIVILQRGDSFTQYEAVGRKVAELPGVAGTNPSTYDEMMVSSDTGSVGAIVKGVDLDGVDRVSRLRSLMVRCPEPAGGPDPAVPQALPGALEQLRYSEDPLLPVAIGTDLARRLRVAPGDRISLTTPVRGLEGGGVGPMGMAPMQGGFRVAGCFESGFFEYDSRLVIMDLKSAQRFLGRGPAVRWIELRIDDLFDTAAMRDRIQGALDPYSIVDLVRDAARLREQMARLAPKAIPENPSVVDLVRAVGDVREAIAYSDVGAGPPQRFRLIDWKEMNRNLFSALRMQKVVLALFFLIIVMVAAFNIVGTQIMVARERVREIATLVALGASRRQLYRVFVAHGTALGCLGVVVGLGLGALVVRIIQGIDFNLDPRVYLIPRLPAELGAGEVLAIGGVSALVVLVSCLLSSLRAMRLNPVDGLRKIS